MKKRVHYYCKAHSLHEVFVTRNPQPTQFENTGLPHIIQRCCFAGVMHRDGIVPFIRTAVENLPKSALLQNGSYDLPAPYVLENLNDQGTWQEFLWLCSNCQLNCWHPFRSWRRIVWYTYAQISSQGPKSKCQHVNLKVKTFLKSNYQFSRGEFFEHLGC